MYTLGWLGGSYEKKSMGLVKCKNFLGLGSLYVLVH